VDSTLMTYVLHAGIVVKCVMLLLLAASFVSWVLIFQRSQFIKQAKQLFENFENQFWSGVELSKLYQQLKLQHLDQEGINGVFSSGYQEFLRLRQRGDLDSEIAFQSILRSMRVVTAKIFNQLELHLPILATIGSVSPYVGLFGTVWGIMTSFQALGGVQQASIAMVAPGISEALIATAMGLFAAIPAVVAYNRFISQVERLMLQYETFQEEFATLMQRQLFSTNTMTGVV